MASIIGIVIILVIALYVYRPKIKGRIGEKIVSSRLKISLPDNYSILNDQIYRTNYGSTQIDHIVVSQYGIFVIETKNYKGWIFGNENSEKWTQNIYGHKFTLTNPIKQNRSHVRVIQKILSDIGKFPIISIVAFSSSASLNITTYNTHVVYWSDLSTTIEQYRTIVINPDDVKKIISALQNANITSSGRNNDHVKRVRNNLYLYDKAINSGICPRCGGRLVERNGRYGNFLGCSNYPNCKFTHRIR